MIIAAVDTVSWRALLKAIRSGLSPFNVGWKQYKKESNAAGLSYRCRKREDGP